VIDDGTIQGSASELEPELIAELEKLSGCRDPRLPSGLFRVATNSDQLHDLADTLCAESQREDCSWENITMERFGDSLAGWRNDIRRGPWIVNNLGRSLPDSCWLSVRDLVRLAFGVQPQTITDFLHFFEPPATGHLDPDELWLLSNALIAATTYE
jgi:hypothetical protein